MQQLTECIRGMFGCFLLASDRTRNNVVSESVTRNITAGSLLAEAAAVSVPIMIDAAIAPSKVLSSQDQEAIEASKREFSQLQSQIATLTAESAQEIRKGIATFLNENISRVHPTVLKQKLHCLFLLRRCYQLSFNEKDHIRRFFEFTDELIRFAGKVDGSEPIRWRDPEVQRQFIPLFVRSLMLTDELLAHAEYGIRQEGKPVHAATIAEHLAVQFGPLYKEHQYELFAHFMHESVFMLYHYFRGEYNWMARGAGGIFWFNVKNNMESYKRGNNPDVYQNKQALPFQLRTLYNTFSKYGFFKYYEGDLRSELNRSDRDERFPGWANVDSSKNDTFSPYHGNRPAAHSKVFYGGK